MSSFAVSCFASFKPVTITSHGNGDRLNRGENTAKTVTASRSCPVQPAIAQQS
ncbi:hypothetical protein QSV37_17425 [Acinetobacter sp. VNK23]|uniref:hypothetical protein n=1 Tax=Acinetobacter thutiue TaxID=2998078 RepID=UPI0025787F1C|nr:hypothetical protein [Acinetobacter thutiue]MDM1022055.1 hypothetical protein [Acinetobacter thutiue]